VHLPGPSGHLVGIDARNHILRVPDTARIVPGESPPMFPDGRGDRRDGM
jgi:hypothetical protein